MKALVLAEGSGTVCNDAETAVDYYQGNFRIVSELIDELNAHCDVETHIITDSYGLIPGSSEISQEIERSKKEGINGAVSLLTKSASDFDIVIVLLTTDIFKQVVAANWNEITEGIKKEAIWCLGTSKSGLSDCNIDDFRENIRELFIYKRVGVVPIDTDTRESLVVSVASLAEES